MDKHFDIRFHVIVKFMTPYYDKRHNDFAPFALSPLMLKFDKVTPIFIDACCPFPHF